MKRRRPTIDDTMIRLCKELATRAACKKRQVGCIITDKNGRIVGTGYNGRSHGMGNCGYDTTCMDGCEGVHAEVNALLQAGSAARTLYCTHAPCWHCMKTIINSPVARVLFFSNTTLEARVMLLAQKCGITLEQS